VDTETDALLQGTVQALGRRSTVLTITHRLDNTVGYDLVLVVERGEVVEYGPPLELVRRQGGQFRRLCEHAGLLPRFEEVAEVTGVSPARRIAREIWTQRDAVLMLVTMMIMKGAPA
jgi:ABC-type multidrug transport system ATPase subunit